VPGGTPYEAVEAFLEPIEQALSCLGRAKIVVSPGGRAAPNRDHVWMVNAGQGLRHEGDLDDHTFYASMHYRIVLADPARHDTSKGKWRVTTAAYFYELRTPANDKLWAMHWHPAGRSPVAGPHLHLYQMSPDGHLVTARQTFESAVQWCLEFGAEPQRPDCGAVLAESESVHKLWRSWSEVPPQGT
jgi:hypothetical protein